MPTAVGMTMIERWMRLRGYAAPDPGAPPALIRDWEYASSRIGHYTRYLRLAAIRRRRAFPRFRVIVPPTPASRWRLYFMYLPKGRLDAGHLYTLDRLRSGASQVLAIVAAQQPDPVLLDQVGARADALIWKALDGFDFSAYALGLDAIAHASPGADVLVMNDSVLGPFGDPDALVSRAQWALTGFTASSRIENHVQSYAFHLSGLLPETMRALRPVLTLDYAFDHYLDVVYGQETRLARVAAKGMSVGALWYTDHPLGDPSLYAAATLTDEGFPFLKRKLLTEHRSLYPADWTDDLLRRHDHPPMR